MPAIDCEQVSAFWNAQAQAYLQPGSAGWIIWSLKMENGGIWSLESCYNGVRCKRSALLLIVTLVLALCAHANRDSPLACMPLLRHRRVLGDVRMRASPGLLHRALQTSLPRDGHCSPFDAVLRRECRGTWHTRSCQRPPDVPHNRIRTASVTKPSSLP